MTTDQGSVIEADLVEIDYLNYRGERSLRRIRPIRIWFGSTDWHPKKQWILDAFDLDRQSERSFAVEDIASWRRASADVPS